MNCLEFRRGVLARPQQLADANRAHAEGCEACRQFLERQQELDARLFEALRVPVPDGLPERILVAQGMRGGGRRLQWALAASVVLAVGAGFLFWPYLSGNRLGHEAIAHVVHEPQSFRLTTRHAPEYLASRLAAQGVRLAAALGEVTYSVLCPLEDLQARHLVVATPDGPVTLLLMPDDAARRARSVTEARGYTAITVPAARGSIAIVAADRRVALAAERLLMAS